MDERYDLYEMCQDIYILDDREAGSGESGLVNWSIYLCVQYCTCLRQYNATKDIT